VLTQIAFEPIRILLSRFAQHPADGLLDEIRLIGMQQAGDVVGEFEREAAAHRGNQRNR
jgi:hypothetical protein